MESPERNEGIPGPVDQGSPFFKYLCGLSPIKPARSVHVVQTYAELSLPPPPAVFSSPPNPPRGGGRVKRGLVVSRTSSTHVTVETVGLLAGAWVVDKENHPSHSHVPKGYLACQADAYHTSSSHTSCEYHQQHLCPKAERDVPEVAGDTPTKFEYADVADYLADPSEGGLYATTSSSQLAAKSYLLQTSPGSGDFGCSGANNEGNLSSDNHDRADDANCASRNSGMIEKRSEARNHSHLGNLARQDTRESLVSRASGASGDLENACDEEGSCVEKPVQVDKDAAAMAYLLVGDARGGGDSEAEWSTETETALPKFSRQTPDFSGHLRSQEEFDHAAPKAVVSERTATADAKEGELEKKDALGQRGIRRRCLDFDTSVRRKSMGGGGSRKSSALRSKPLTGSSAATSVTSIPSSVLCERAAATSDATNSATAPALEGQSDLQGRSECISSATNVLSPGLLRVSRCSFQRSSDFLALEQRSVEQSRALRDSGNPSSSVGIPSGIGLHLNSLTGSISFSPTNREFKQTMGIGSATKGTVASLLGMPVLGGMPNDNRCEGFGNSVVGLGRGPQNFTIGSTTSSFSPGMVISMMEKSRLTVRESLPAPDTERGMLETKTLQSLSMVSRQSLDGNRLARVGVLDKKFGPVGKKRLLHQDILQPANLDFVDEYDSPRSPKKRRKSPSSTGEKSGEGCKRCNCKKSKCLKLYCECFAAGTYCVGSCTCHDCFNKPEHEETVMSTRQQIESRNPLAFAPKIIHSGDASPKRGVEEIIETPASARHKRGCNCKKSLCLKKYCECYQAGVGCSEGCRCEGCKNMYGRKEAIEDSDDKDAASDALERGSQDDEVELAKPGFPGGVGKTEPRHDIGKDLSPITPSFQYTGQGRTIGRISKSSGKKRSASPLSECQSGPKIPRSPVNATRCGMSFTSDEDPGQTPDLQHTRNGNTPVSTPKLCRMNQLSPRWDGLGDICTLTPLPQPPLRPTPASISTLDRAGASPSFSRQSIEPISSFQSDKLDSVSNNSPLAFQESLDHSPLSTKAHHAQTPSNRRTPCTPRLSSSAFPGKDIVKAGDARSGQLSNFLLEDDGTPDFLKYSHSMNSPIVTKSSSPKQKRVSPPHFEGMRERNRVDYDSPARSSPSLRSGRKFILQALPSHP